VSVLLAREEDVGRAEAAQAVSLTAFLVDTYLHRSLLGSIDIGRI
jgi:hypothetical protein